MHKQTAELLYNKSMNAVLKLHSTFIQVKNQLPPDDAAVIQKGVALAMGEASSSLFDIFTIQYPEIDRVAAYNREQEAKGKVK